MTLKKKCPELTEIMVNMILSATVSSMAKPPAFISSGKRKDIYTSQPSGSAAIAVIAHKDVAF